jgi:FMN phosphatase YigB (HAD superfamily)
MTKKLAILFDLDDTLLINDMDHFLPGYINALISSLPQIPGERLQTALMAGTRKMLRKNMPVDTLEETFYTTFYPKLGINQEEIQKTIEEFYKKEFPKLKHLTQTRPESAAIVHQLSQEGHAITIATSPLFPYAAQRWRLEWAGITYSEDVIDEITSFENYHFCKPHPEYFIEVIIKNQYTHMPVVMIGNSLTEDIIPCEKLGIPTYWVTTEGKNEVQGELSTAGDFSGIPQWIEQIAEKVEPIQWNNNMENSISLLKSTPSVFEHYCKKFKNHPILTSEKENNSVVKILRHVLEGDKQLNIPRVRQFFMESKPVITGMDLDALSSFSDYANNDFCHLLSQFIDIRMQLLDIIQNADPETINKQAMHTIFGPTSFSEIIQFIAIHDLSHLDDCNILLNHHANE